MKRLPFLLLLLCGLLLYSACAETPPLEQTPPLPAQTAEDSAPEVSPPTWDAAALLQCFDELSMAAGYGCIDELGDSITVYDLPQATVYLTGDILTQHLIYQLKADASWHYLDTGLLHCYPVLAVEADRDDPDLILVSCESRSFGFDTQMVDFPCTLRYSIAAGRAQAVQYHADSGVYGQESNRDNHVFAACVVDGDTASFSFALAEDSPGYGHPGPEVTIETYYRDDSVEGYPYPRNLLVGFRNTPNTLPASFLAELRALPGLAEVTLHEEASPIFSGTVLLITPEEDYVIETWFNQSNALNTMESWHFRPVERTGYVIEGITKDGSLFYESVRRRSLP